VRLPVALTIAGSDSGGGAGIQADLKTFAFLGVHGTSAITAITAQNTTGVIGILELPVALIAQQIDAVVDDIGVQAAKTGMLSSAEIIATVADALERHHIELLVVDPVMVAKGGAKLLREDAVDALRSRLIPLAAVVTPNMPEAEVLLGRTIHTLEERRQAARDIVAMGARAAVVKGGHAEGDATDVFFDGSRLLELRGDRITTANTHGSGCVFSAAITAGLARGQDTATAVHEAKEFITRAIAASLELGHGHGPVNPAFGPAFGARVRARVRAPAGRRHLGLRP
jgi:hydroxymethylpyrimidine/phosphomethylpyrimidine kinase